MSRPKGPRGLSDADRMLWEQVVAQTAPMHPRRQKVTFPASTVPPAPQPEPRPPAADPIAPFRIGQQASDTRPAFDLGATGAKAGAVVRMDQKSFNRMRRGKLPVEARVDLHGMTLAEAQPALSEFVLGSRALGRRLVLVITGKGRSRQRDPFGDRAGLLKRQVPHWLRMAPLAGAVLQIAEAHQSHGGSGAYYVYLRRS